MIVNVNEEQTEWFYNNNSEIKNYLEIVKGCEMIEFDLSKYLLDEKRKFNDLSGEIL